MINNIVEPIRNVSGRILISKAFRPSILAGAGPLGA